MSETSKRIRIEWLEGDKKRDAGLTTPEDVVRFDNLRYGSHPEWQLLDVYRPKEAEGKKLPVIMNVHGGGWVYGTKETYQFYAMSLAQRGFAVVNYSYRLAPEYQFPAPLEDTNIVVRWMYEHAEAYGLDMDHVFMVGDSAGGHLCGLYAAICTNPAYAAKFDFAVPNHFVPTALGLNCGAYVPLGGGPELLNKAQDQELMNDFLAAGGSEEEKELICVHDHVTEAYPPVYLMSCLGDFCLPHAPYLKKALEEKGVCHAYVIYGTEEEPLFHVFHVNMRNEEGRRCNDEECAFFRRMMDRAKA